jgi:hypothetical protein
LQRYILERFKDRRATSLVRGQIATFLTDLKTRSRGPRRQPLGRNTVRICLVTVQGMLGGAVDPDELLTASFGLGLAKKLKLTPDLRHQGTPGHRSALPEDRSQPVAKSPGTALVVCERATTHSQDPDHPNSVTAFP